MGYSIKDSMVRFSLFKPNGKWYEDFVIDMSGYYKHPIIHNAVKLAFLESKNVHKQYEKEHKGWKLVCLEPYHEFSHPIMIEF